MAVQNKDYERFLGEAIKGEKALNGKYAIDPVRKYSGEHLQQGRWLHPVAM